MGVYKFKHGCFVNMRQKYILALAHANLIRLKNLVSR